MVCFCSFLSFKLCLDCLIPMLLNLLTSKSHYSSNDLNQSPNLGSVPPYLVSVYKRMEIAGCMYIHTLMAKPTYIRFGVTPSPHIASYAVTSLMRRCSMFGQTISVKVRGRCAYYGLILVQPPSRIRGLLARYRWLEWMS